MKPFLTLAETHPPDGSRFTLHGHDGECYSIEAHFCPAAATAEMILATAGEKANEKLSCSELRNPLSTSAWIYLSNHWKKPSASGDKLQRLKNALVPS
jgi:hypothetical protein